MLVVWCFFRKQDEEGGKWLAHVQDHGRPLFCCKNKGIDKEEIKRESSRL